MFRATSACTWVMLGKLPMRITLLCGSSRLHPANRSAISTHITIPVQNLFIPHILPQHPRGVKQQMNHAAILLFDAFTRVPFSVIPAD